MRLLVSLLFVSAVSPLALQAAAPRARVAPPEDAHDLVVLHPARPYRIRFHLRVDGKPFIWGWNQQVNHLFRFLDTDGDGRLSKAEAARAPSREQWQQLAGAADQVEPDVAPDFALLARGKPAAVEDLRAYYAPTSAGPLQVRWSKKAGSTDSLSDALFRRLDTNRDGKLSHEELKSARSVLNRLDGNEDEVISPSEIMGFPFSEGQGDFRRGPAHGPAFQGLPFFSARPGAPTASLIAALMKHYDRKGSRKPGREELGFDPKTFALLDRNRDGKLNAEELTRWLDLPADLEVEAPLTGAGRLRVVPTGAATLKTTPTHEGMLVFLGDWRLELRGETAASRQRPQVSAQSLFRFLDKKKKGYLETAEVYQPPFTYVAWLRLADRDRDGRISEKEFIAFDELRDKVQGTMTSLRVEDLGRSLFRLLDSNRDGRLGQRELRDAWRRAELIGLTRSGGFRRDQLPPQYRLTLRHGPDIDNQPLPGRPTPPPQTRGPLWFRKMDRNGDGDVSRSEWLGSEEQFREIDSDGDGLISIEEAERYDKRMRRPGK